jgi:hypothetical protein
MSVQALVRLACPKNELMIDISVDDWEVCSIFKYNNRCNNQYLQAMNLPVFGLA